MALAKKKAEAKRVLKKRKPVEKEAKIYSIRELDMIERIIRVEDELVHINDNIRLVVAQMDKRFESMQRNMDARFEQMDKRFEQMQHNMDTRFKELREDMNKRFTQMVAFISIVFTVIGVIITVFRVVG